MQLIPVLLYKHHTPMIVSQIIFTISASIAFGLFGRQVARIRRNIFLGKSEKITGHIDQRLKNMLLVAFGQKKMFKRIIPALLHLSIYVAFIITQVELLEIIADGVAGEHRLIWSAVENTPFAGFYTFVISFIEVLSLLALIATFIFLARRNLLKIPRFQKSEMNGWPKLDGNIILYFEIYLVTCIFLMNSADLALQSRDIYHHTQPFAISQFIAPIFSGTSDGTLLFLERLGWWGHIFGVLVFLNYIPHSKHLHIFLAFPNTYYAKLTPKGQLNHMPEITKEVAPLFEEEEPITTKATATKEPTPNETIDDIFGESDKEESLDDIFGDAGSSEQNEESLDDIFGDAGSSEQNEESLDDIFGDAGSSEQEEENLDDIFGDTGSSEQSEESLDDIFGDAGSSKQEESIDDIFGGGDSEEENLDDIFGDSQEQEEENIDDLFGDGEQETEPQTQTIAAVAEPPVEEIQKFGVHDVFDLSWKNIMDAYTCTECGRCTSECPANLTGKKLSPRKIMMDVRDRAEEIGKNIDANKTEYIKKGDTSKKLKLTKYNYDDGKSLFDYISNEELHACTTCNACVEACPVLINPLDIIMQLRRNLILDKAVAPEAWSVMFTNIENNAAPWQFSQNDRDKWVDELE